MLLGQFLDICQYIFLNIPAQMGINIFICHFVFEVTNNVNNITKIQNLNILCTMYNFVVHELISNILNSKLLLQHMPNCPSTKCYIMSKIISIAFSAISYVA